MHESLPHPPTRLKFTTSITSGGTPKADAANWDGDVPFVTPPDLNGLDGKTVEAWGRTLTAEGARRGSSTASNAVLLSCRAPIGHIGTTVAAVAFNQGCKALRPNEPDDLRFLAYALVAGREALSAAGRGTTFSELSTGDLADCTIPWPHPGVVRQRIADYLDRETGEIDAMIAKMDELAERLEERRATAVKTAALGGFSPIGGDASGIPIGAIGSVVLGKMLDVKRGRPEGAADLPYIRAANIQSDGLRLNDVKAMPFTPREAGNLSLCRDDILVVEGGAVGTAVLLTEDMAGWSFQKTVNRIRPGRQVDPRWLAYVLRSYRTEGLFDLICSGTTIAHLTAEKLAALRVPLLDPEEQKRIADHLDEVTSRIGTMLAKVAELKSLLTERRAALIADVVTGRKEVV